MDLQRLIDDVLSRGAFGGPEEARRAVEAVLGAFGACLVPDEARALSADFHGSIGRLVLDNATGAEASREAIYRRTAVLENVPLGRAAEHTQIVLMSMVEHVPEAILLRLVRHLGPDVGELLTPRRPAEEPPIRLHQPKEPALGKGHTLSTGRPGSSHPVSEAHLETAQTHSVARSENPHEDTKISSSHGLTQEREHETLAEGRAGPKRPLGESR